VARYVKEPPVPGSSDSALPEEPKRAVKARHPHHTWHLFEKPPTAPEMAAFVDRAISSLGKPKYLVVDQGGEFTGDAFREMVGAYRVKLRYDSAENHRANSRLERFWRSLKHLLGLNGLSRPLTASDAERDIAMALAYFAHFRPHTGLGGATPAEVYHNLEPAHLHAVQPPRGERGDPPVRWPAAVEYLDGDRRFPFLRQAA
jgi:transposase InsO family protein